MNTGQVLFAILAFILLAAVTLNFNSTGASTADAVQYAQNGILLTTVATSYEELARGLAFDASTDSDYVPPSNLSSLTPAALLGPDDPSESNLYALDDVDDFNSQVFETEIPGSGKRFASRFSVYYVNPNDITQPLSTPTLAKRMDILTWQSFPLLINPVASDTLSSYVIFGYFHFE